MDLPSSQKVRVGAGGVARRAEASTRGALQKAIASYNGNPLVDVRTGARHADGRLGGLWIRHGLKKGTRVRAGRFTKYQNR
jgi:hypothetical protein